jgi:hypothetical protein
MVLSAESVFCAVPELPCDRRCWREGVRVSSAGPASRSTLALTGSAKPGGRTCSAVNRVIRATGAVCLVVGLVSCAARPLSAQKAPNPSGPPRAPVKTATRLPQPAAVDDRDAPIAPAIVSLVQKIYAAAVHADYSRLKKLLTDNCPYPSLGLNAQVKLWHRPGVLHEMTALLLTHGALEDGYTYPGFALAGFQTSYDYEDAAALHVKAPRIPTMTPSYRGPTIEIGDEPPAFRITWCGITNYQK